MAWTSDPPPIVRKAGRWAGAAHLTPIQPLNRGRWIAVQHASGAAVGVGNPSAITVPKLAATAQGIGAASATTKLYASASASGVGNPSAQTVAVITGSAAGVGNATASAAQAILAAAAGVGQPDATLVAVIMGTAFGVGTPVATTHVVGVRADADGTGSPAATAQFIETTTAAAFGVGAPAAVIKAVLVAVASGTGAAAATAIAEAAAAAMGIGAPSATVIVRAVLAAADGTGTPAAAIVAKENADASGTGTPDATAVDVTPTFTPFTVENVTIVNDPVPFTSAGCWVDLLGGGNKGGNGLNGTTGIRGGGSGGGGGGRIKRQFIPIAQFVGATYSTAPGAMGTASTFSCGAKSLSANAGTVGHVGLAADSANAGGAGGTTTITGFTGVTGVNGGTGGAGGSGNVQATAGGSTTTGGGGGGGGAAGVGTNGSITNVGGNGGTATFDADDGDGGKGGNAFSTTAVTGSPGANYGGGGGGGGGRANGSAVAIGANGGIGHNYVQWVAAPPKIVSFTGVSNAAGQSAGTTTTAGTAAITPTLPAGTVSGKRVFVIQCATTTSAAAPANWNVLFQDLVIGTGAVAAGAGQRFVSCYWRDYDGVWTMPSFALPSALNVSQWIAAVTLEAAAGETLAAPIASAASSDYGTANTALATTPGSLTTFPDSILLAITIRNDNVTSSAAVLTQAGATLEAPIERADGGTATGNDVSGSVGTSYVRAGATAAFVFNKTLSAASEGGTIIVQQSCN